MVSIFTNITDLFYKIIGLKKHKNHYSDLVDDVDYFAIYGSQVGSVIACSICLFTIPKLSTPCGVYSNENNNKCSIAKRGSTNE